eukprot:4442322-Pleurochrysis_carterae.AAC.2
MVKKRETIQHAHAQSSIPARVCTRARPHLVQVVVAAGQVVAPAADGALAALVARDARMDADFTGLVARPLRLVTVVVVIARVLGAALGGTRRGESMTKLDRRDLSVILLLLGGELFKLRLAQVVVVAGKVVAAGAKMSRRISM